MPDNTINWGQGAVENTNDWGKGKTNSANNWGKVYETSPSGDTNIEGGLALTITYSANAYCDGIGDTPQPTVAGNTGSGTFSSTAGLTINSSTGIIDVDASTKGATYLVTYTDTDSDTATANITLNALDNAAFAYSASSYEPTDADPTPTITGLTGGTFSSTSGLVFVDSGTNTGSSTGQIDLSATTIASYTITYDTTSSGSSVCPNTSTQTVEIALAGIANNYSMNFDGTNDYLSFDNISITSQFSVSCWVYPTNSNGLYTILGDNTSSNYYRIYQAIGRTDIKISGTEYFYVSGAPLSLNAWQHLVITRDNNNTIHFYMNGTEYTQNQPTNASGTFGAIDRIGQKLNANFLQGNLDEVAIWDTALTSTQVSEIYNATSNNLTKDLSTVSGSNLKLWLRMGD